jgi:SpoVK/Ycf46/Vps4 family AAA+-type ATPase
LNLYRIDLSAVVSKYVGDTEKNLRRLFDAAEDGGAILLFDEADALFGKRSEVKDSHDRYANIEINYLLQRLESFHGLAILATNVKSALDPAFTRRLRFIVNFPFPALADRRRLWQQVFPQREAGTNAAFTPVAGLDYDRLARFNLPGGDISNIALHAAFLAAADAERKTAAAEEGPMVTMPLILEAARAQFLKRDRPINEADFRWSPTVPMNGNAVLAGVRA